MAIRSPAILFNQLEDEVLPAGPDMTGFLFLHSFFFWQDGKGGEGWDGKKAGWPIESREEGNEGAFFTRLVS